MAKFSTLISSPGALRFGMAYPVTQIVFAYDDFDTVNNTQTIMSSVSDGTQFRTAFRRTESCQNWRCEHDFAGSLYY
jgi:hypothetical protein